MEAPNISAQVQTSTFVRRRVCEYRNSRFGTFVEHPRLSGLVIIAANRKLTISFVIYGIR